jgi:hypothetical protein
MRSAHAAIDDRQRGAATVALLVPAALIAVGVLMWRRQSAPLNGINAPYGAFPLAGVNAPYGAFPLAGFGSSFKKAVSRVQKAVPRPVAAVLTAGGSEISRTVIKQGKKVDASVFKNTRWGRKLRPANVRKGRGAAGQVVYQDEHGNVITEAQYNAAMADSGTSYTEIVSPEQAQGGGGGGGGGGSDYSLPPEAPQAPADTSQQYADSSADMPTPEPSSVNPLIAIGTLIAVPVIMGLTKGH